MTPLSGELRSESTWEPSDPTAPAPRRKKERAAPTTWAGAIFRGIFRAMLVLALLAGIAVVIATLFVWLGDSDPARAFSLSFIFTGVLIALGGFMGATTGPSADWMPAGGFSSGEREHALNMSFVYGFFGVILVVIGVALDSVL